jgi:predicted small metal-binding protein
MPGLAGSKYPGGMMLYRYSCKDMGLNCSFVVKSETLEEATQKALQHVREMHTADFNNIQSAAQIRDMEKALARSVRVVAG